MQKRIIKFRAWDKTLNEFLPNVQNHINDTEWAFGSMLKNDRWVIQQYTDLKDKNGNEIYEGDILTDDYGSIGVVEWNMDDASFIVIYGDETQGFDAMNEWAIVTGNIYENKELLTK